MLVEAVEEIVEGGLIDIMEGVLVKVEVLAEGPEVLGVSNLKIQVRSRM